MGRNIDTIYLTNQFKKYNTLYFNGILPLPKFIVTNTKHTLGQYRYRRYEVFNKHTICVTNYYDIDDKKIDNILIHEMIHYYISINNIKDTSTHGKVFRQIMNSVNERFERNITISHKATDEEKEQLCGTKRRWHVVAVVSLDNGRTGVKVLPRVMPMRSM